MTDPTELTADDTITFDTGPLSGVECDVSDTDVKDIGLAEVFAVGFTDGSDVWMLRGSTADETAKLAKDTMNGIEEETELDWSDIRRV